MPPGKKRHGKKSARRGNLRITDFVESPAATRAWAMILEAGEMAAVMGCFVLRPEKDMAARAALRVYARETMDAKLATDLHAWLDGLDGSRE
jgi:hypothetical protein